MVTRELPIKVFVSADPEHLLPLSDTSPGFPKDRCHSDSTIRLTLDADVRPA